MLHFYGYTGSAWSWIFAETIIAATLWYYLRSQNYNPVKPELFKPRMVLQEVRALVTNMKKRSL
jgi:Na+-driven multidrug efflux pump